MAPRLSVQDLADELASDLFRAIEGLTHERNRSSRRNYPVKIREVGEPLLNDMRKALAYFRKAQRVRPPPSYAHSLGQLLERRAATQQFGNNPRNEAPNFRTLAEVTQQFQRKHRALKDDSETFLAVWAWAVRILSYYVDRETLSLPRSVPRQEPARVETPPESLASVSEVATAVPQTTVPQSEPEDGVEEQRPGPAQHPPTPVELKKLELGAELTGNRKGELRVPSLGRGVRVDLNLKGFAQPKGKTVIGYVSRQDAGGSLSGGFRGTLVDFEVDGATLYLVLKPAPKPREGGA